MRLQIWNNLAGVVARLPNARIVLGLLGLAIAAQAAIAQSGEPALEQRIAHAQQFTSDKLLAKVRNNGLAFRWIGRSDRFWFRKTLENGSSEYVVVDAATGRQQPLFDQTAMMAALGAAGAKGTPRVTNADLIGEGSSIRLSVAGPDSNCLWPSTPGRCRLPADTYICDIPVKACRALPESKAAILRSPDGTQAAYIKDYNLWVRDTQSGAERQLTTAGVENFAYGDPHDQGDSDNIYRRRYDEPKPLRGLMWSPDGRYILSIRSDLRTVPERHIITEYLPPEGVRPFVFTQREAIAADSKYPDAKVEVIDVAAGVVRASAADPQMFDDYTQLYMGLGEVWWSKDNENVSLIGFRRGAREARFMRIDLRTGRVSNLVTETADSWLLFNRNALTVSNVELLSSGNEAVWFSERDGWGHLYLYDTRTGRVKRQITKGAWTVSDLVHVDEAARQIYFTAAGREPDENVYYRHLYRVGLDGGAPQLLTPENADHSFGENLLFSGGSRQGGSMSPTGRYFIDSYSTIQQPDQVVIRRADGTKVADVISADISALLATGWRPPEPFRVKAADGKTDLYGVIFKPINFDPSKKYPIVEVMYPMTGSKFTPTAFWENFTRQGTLNAQAFAENGAVVVSLDGRGAGLRSLAFRNSFVGTNDFMGLEDHVAAIRNLAADKAYMDLNRVGATGHSNGGYGTLRGMLLFPDFYKVGVSGEGPADHILNGLEVSTERYLGVPDTPQMRDYYEQISNANDALAKRLNGKLLLIYGGADESVSIQEAFQTFMSLQKAGKVYDTLIMPDSPHYGGREPYGVMRTLHYFAEHLGGPQ